ncbi:hypothetical protein C0J52_25322, partial [Blattella germanica]
QWKEKLAHAVDGSDGDIWEVCGEECIFPRVDITLDIKRKCFILIQPFRHRIPLHRKLHLPFELAGSRRNEIGDVMACHKGRGQIRSQFNSVYPQGGTLLSLHDSLERNRSFEATRREFRLHFRLGRHDKVPSALTQ